MSLTQEFQRVLRTAGYSLDGWRHAWREEKSLRQWSGINLLGWLALALVQPPLWAVALVVLAGLLLLVLELVNSAIEAAVDYVSTERHPLAKAAKDAGSAAVAVMGLGYVALWSITLLARFG
jgi:diacylglycerol kinase (ATP)